jgi:hypothetical protein
MDQENGNMGASSAPLIGTSCTAAEACRGLRSLTSAVAYKLFSPVTRCLFMSVYISLIIYLSIYLPIYLPVYLPICLSTYLIPSPKY